LPGQFVLIARAQRAGWSGIASRVGCWF